MQIASKAKLQFRVDISWTDDAGEDNYVNWIICVENFIKRQTL